MATTDRPDDAFSDSDQLWFDRLGGRPVPAERLDSDAVREADALRLALQVERDAAQADAAVQAATSDEALAQQWQQLRFALKREGLLQAPATPWWRQWPAAGALAAAVLLVAVLPRQFGRDELDEPPGLRGEFVLKQQPSADPARAAKDFVAALARAGLKPGLYRRGKVYVVDVDLKPDQLAAAAPAFSALALTPAPGLWRVEFAAP